MTRGDEREAHDRDVTYREFFEKKQREYLITLVDEQLIEEHRQRPLGQHSEPLERLLLYFRRAPRKEKYAVWRDERQGCFRVVTLSGDRGAGPGLVDDQAYATAEEAYHAIFLRRVNELLEGVT